MVMVNFDDDDDDWATKPPILQALYFDDILTDWHHRRKRVGTALLKSINGDAFELMQCVISAKEKTGSTCESRSDGRLEIQLHANGSRQARPFLDRWAIILRHGKTKLTNKRWFFRSS